MTRAPSEYPISVTGLSPCALLMRASASTSPAFSLPALATLEGLSVILDTPMASLALRLAKTPLNNLALGITPRSTLHHDADRVPQLQQRLGLPPRRKPLNRRPNNTPRHHHPLLIRQPPGNPNRDPQLPKLLLGLPRAMKITNGHKPKILHLPRILIHHLARHSSTIRAKQPPTKTVLLAAAVASSPNRPLRSPRPPSAAVSPRPLSSAAAPLVGC